MIIDLSMYPVVKPLSDFVNGKCLICFTTTQKESYVGLIDFEGKFLFIHLDNFIKYNEEKIEFRDCYFDWYGNYYLKSEE